METLAGSRHNGKTTKLIQKFLAAPNGIMIVANSATKQLMIERIKGTPFNGCKYSRVMTVHEYLSGFWRGTEFAIDSNFPLFIDNLEQCINALINRNVAAATICASGPGSIALGQEITTFKRMLTTEAFRNEYCVEYWKEQEQQQQNSNSSYDRTTGEVKSDTPREQKLPVGQELTRITVAVQTTPSKMKAFVYDVPTSKLSEEMERVQKTGLTLKDRFNTLIIPYHRIAEIVTSKPDRTLRTKEGSTHEEYDLAF